MIIEKTASARAGLAGNPSDGYFGKTVSVILKNFRAKVLLYESPELRIEPHYRDNMAYESLDAFIDDLTLSGMYGGIRLLKATIKKFHEYVTLHDIELPHRNFTLRYETDIPRRLGLAGSSAIITAAMKALCEFFEVEIPKPLLPTLILRVETEELGIAAGLQDRVIQVYEGCVYMDFARGQLEEYQYGRYESLDTEKLPPLYVAYRENLSEGTEVVHNNLRERWEMGNPEVRQAMQRFGMLAEEFYKALREEDLDRMFDIMNENFDLRASIMQISQDNWDLINAARNVEASAKFSGSGGAIVGIYRDEAMFEALQKAMQQIDAKAVKVQY